jgi:hypothetical protein
VHVKIIAEVTGVLSDQDAAVADELLAGAAPGRTYGELRAAANRLVLRLDPDAARKRKETARRQAHVRAFREESGNAGITGRELPSAEVLASMQHVQDRARALRAAGVPGTWEELKAAPPWTCGKNATPGPPRPGSCRRQTMPPPTIARATAATTPPDLADTGARPPVRAPASAR